MRNTSASGIGEAEIPLSPTGARPTASSHGKTRRIKTAAPNPTLCMMDTADEGFGDQAARESSLARGYDALDCTNFHSMDALDSPANGIAPGFGFTMKQGSRQPSRSKGSAVARPGTSAGLGGSFRAASSLTMPAPPSMAVTQAPSALAMDLGEDVLREPKLMGKRVEQAPMPARSLSVGSTVVKSGGKESPPATAYVRKSKRNMGPSGTHSAGSVAWSVHMARAAQTGTAGLRRHHSEGRLAPAF